MYKSSENSFLQTVRVVFILKRHLPQCVTMQGMVVTNSTKEKNEKNAIHQFGSKSKISFLYLSEIYSTHVVILFVADLV